MTAHTTPPPTGAPAATRLPTASRGSTSWRRFGRHYLLMVLAMYAGMLALDPVYAAVAARAGYQDPWIELPVISALVMAVNMTIPMLLLMRGHGHSLAAMVEMAGSMVIPTVVAAGLHLGGIIPAELVMTVTHVSMFPAMLLVMLCRYREYA